MTGLKRNLANITAVIWNAEEKPQRVVYNKVLASERMLPNNLQRHLTS